MNMKTGGVFLLFLLNGLPTGLGTNCHKCHARNSDYCKGVEMKCPEGSSCMTVSELSGVKPGGDHTYRSIQKRCSNNMKCDTYMYAYASDIIYFDLLRQCCKGELCNNGTFSMPNKTFDYDGPECPYCASFDTLEECKPVGTEVCRSATDRCFSIFGWMRKPDDVRTKFSAMGCISGLACKYDTSENVGFFVEKVMKLRCWLPKKDNHTSMEESEE